MLGISLTVVALAFVPVLLLNIAWSEHVGWIGSSMIAALWITIVGVRIIRRSRPVKELPGYSIRGERLIAVLLVGGVVGFLLNSTGLLGVYSYEVYLASLLLGLTASGLLFGRVNASLLKGRGSE
jgi:hypothetical protein